MDRGSVAGITSSDALLMEVARGAPAALYQFRRDPSGEYHISFVSARFARMFGIEPGESKATATLFFARIHPDDVGPITEAIDHSAATLSPFRGEFRYRLATGSEIWFEACSNAEREANGGTVWNGIATDITERKRAQEVREATYLISEAATNTGNLDDFFKRSREILGALIPVRNFYIALVDRETETLHFPYFVDEVNPPPATRPLGRGLTEYVLRTGEPLLASLEVFDDLVARGEVVSLGAPSVDWLGAPLKAFGKIIGAVVVQTYAAEVRFKALDKDVLSFVSNQLAIAIERKWAEKALQQSEAALAEAQHLAHVGSWQWDLVSNTLTWSDEMYPIFGFTHETFDGKPESLLKVVHPEDRHHFVERMEDNLSRGIAFPLEYRVIRPDGEERTVYAQGTIVRDDSGTPVKSVGTVQDVTERRQLEAQLAQSQKMEAVGRLAGGVAHDFNNLLTVIQGYGEVLYTSLANDSARRESVVEIVKAAERATALTRQLLAFSRQQVLEMRVLDIGAVVADTEKMLKRLIGEDIEVVVVKPPALSRVKADSGQIAQVVLNLAVNARDAMPGGGRLTVELADADLEAPLAAAQDSIPPGRYVVLSFTDTGTGMDAETAGHIFEPFFTTKEKGKGTGLGLATVYGIVRQTGGYVAVETAPGAGTTFRVYLSRCTEPITSGTRPSVSSRRGTETVLVVEDEPAVRNLVRAVLERKGYVVLVAQDGAAALDLVDRHAGVIHVLLTDVVMPGMNGRDLAALVRTRRPMIKAILMSGYAADISAELGTEGGPLFLSKPFTDQTLTAKLREALEMPQA